MGSTCHRRVMNQRPRDVYVRSQMLHMLSRVQNVFQRREIIGFLQSGENKPGNKTPGDIIRLSRCIQGQRCLRLLVHLLGGFIASYYQGHTLAHKYTCRLSAQGIIGPGIEHEKINPELLITSDLCSQYKS